MRLLSILAVFGMFSVPRLSHDSVTLLVQHYFKDKPPSVYLADLPLKKPVVDALVSNGLFTVSHWTGSCGEDQSQVHLTAKGRDVGLRRDWKLTQDGDAVTIPLGSFSLVTESLTYSKQRYLPGSIHFSYWFRGNDNVPFLLSLASSAAWGSVGMDDGGGVFLDEANRLMTGTLPIRWQEDGWVIKGPYQPAAPVC